MNVYHTTQAPSTFVPKVGSIKFIWWLLKALRVASVGRQISQGNDEMVDLNGVHPIWG